MPRSAKEISSSWSSVPCHTSGRSKSADVPGRCEPGTGEISYPAVAAALDRHGYTGVVGLEGGASGDPELALKRFETAFTVN